MFDVIERLKTDWTDKYVVIDSEAPELARFAKTTGQVKTVNMNGRCLVEFDQFNNIGWYDIDPSALKVVPKPLPKPPEAKEPKAAPAPKTDAKTAPKTDAKPAAAAAKKPSTADILAAARGKAGGAAPAVAKPAGKPSTAEILAQARGAKAPAPAAAQEATEEATETGAAEEPAEMVAPESKAAAPKKAAGGPLPTTTADKIAWCRGHDAKS